MFIYSVNSISVKRELLCKCNTPIKFYYQIYLFFLLLNSYLTDPIALAVQLTLFQ